MTHVQSDQNYKLWLDSNPNATDEYASPVASMAVLADDNQDWKPNSYSYDVLGCQHNLNFPVAKLLDFADRIDSLEQNNNPFALVTAAHLRTKQTRQDTDASYQAKRTLVRLLYQQGWDKQRVLDLFAVLDWMMRLPNGLEQKLWQEIEEIDGEQNMRYVTSVERLAIQRGKQLGIAEGIEQGLERGKIRLLEKQLTFRFGPLSDEAQQRLQNATQDQLDHWAERILNAPTLQAVFDGH